MPPFGGQFVHQFPDGVHPVQSAHVGPAEEQPLFHIAFHRFDEGVGDAVGHLCGVAGQVHAQTVQGAAVHAGKQHGGVHIAALEVGQLVHGCCGKLAGSGRAGQ